MKAGREKRKAESGKRKEPLCWSAAALCPFSVRRPDRGKAPWDLALTGLPLLPRREERAGERMPDFPGFPLSPALSSLLRRGAREKYRRRPTGSNSSDPNRLPSLHSFRQLQLSPGGKGRGCYCHLPKGDLKIAHPFKGGFVEGGPPVPKGRLKFRLMARSTNRPMTLGRFIRPFGTGGMSPLNPAVNCRAILKSPSGRRKTLAKNPRSPAWSRCLPHRGFAILKAPDSTGAPPIANRRYSRVQLCATLNPAVRRCIHRLFSSLIPAVPRRCAGWPGLCRSLHPRR